LNVAKDVHHYNYERAGKEQIGMDPEASEENDLIALCRECHTALHAKGQIIMYS
jgi:predicted HNH restriction endonuclease